jgi:hypothetical protein
MTDSFKLKLHIPDKQPFEGNATQKQKQYIWDLGYRDEEVIAGSARNKQALSLTNYLDHNATYGRRNAVARSRLLGLRCW